MIDDGYIHVAVGSIGGINEFLVACVNNGER